MKNDKAPATTVSSPSRMKIQACQEINASSSQVEKGASTQAGLPPTPSMLEIAAASRPGGITYEHCSWGWK